MPDVGGSEFGKRKPPGGHHHGVGREVAPRSDDLEAIVLCDFLHTATAKDPHSRLTALPFQHGDDRAGTAVAELLAEFLLMVGDSVLLHETDEIPRREACQRRFAEVGVLREIVRRRRVDIGEVAAAPAGDLDFPADTVVVLEQQDALAAVCRGEGAEQPGASSADHDHVRMFRCLSVHAIVMTSFWMKMKPRPGDQGGVLVRDLLGDVAKSVSNVPVTRITAFLCFACSASFLQAEVSLAPVFGDHMVIQQGVTLPVWGKASPGETVIVACAGREARTVADGSGSWRVILRPVFFSGEGCDLIVNGANRIEIHDVLPGDVWIAAGDGEMASRLASSSIGERASTIPDPGTRFFVRDESGKGRWLVVSPESSLSLPSVPFFFARDLRAARKTPIGIIDCTTESPSSIASWVSPSGLAGLAPLHDARESSSLLFRSLIRPLVPFAITGVVWGQGSSDLGRDALRHRLFLAHLIRDWRDVWEQGPFPFLMILPPAGGSPDGLPVEPYPANRGQPLGAMPWIREGIAAALRLPNTGIAVATDLGGDGSDGLDPLVAGRRLALTARRLVYGEEIPFTGPVFRHARIEQNRIRLFFEGVAGGLTVGSAPASGSGHVVAVSSLLKGFAVRGREGRWFPAEARIDGETILLSSDAVPKPLAARYGWKNRADGNLYDKSGLPAPPFRTDSDPPR